MTDTDTRGSVSTLRVLHVDDDDGVRGLVSSFLSHERPELDVVSVPSGLAALDRLADVDCVVSDYDMPEMDGLTFLRRVRVDHPDLPFVLYTAAGSEEIAAEAISAGVTDYLQKSTGREQYTLLANRVHNLATQYRTARELDEQGRRFRKLVEHSSDVVSIVDADGVFQYLSPASRHVFGYEPDELVGESGLAYLHPDDVEYVAETLTRAIVDPTERPVITFRFAHPERGWIVLENVGRNLLDDPLIAGFVINSHDVTGRVERAVALERQRDRLAEFAEVVSHDLRNPLSVAGSNLSLLEETGDLAHTGHVRLALERMERIIDDLLTLAHEGDGINSLSSVGLPEIADAAWRSVDSKDASLAVETDAVVQADAGRLQQLLENIFANAVEHAGPAAHVRVVDVRHDGECDGTDVGSGVGAGRGPSPGAGAGRGPSPGAGRGPGPGSLARETLDVPCGFAVVDDGPGIPPAERDRIFEHGTSSTPGRTGFGLAIVRRVVEAHGWTVAVTDGDDGGVRFEFHGVRPSDDRGVASSDPRMGAESDPAGLD